jgi:asparagine synthetase B (glutamine-hydrolysing)
MGTFGQYMVGKYIAETEECKVVLSGEGADELFGGYARLIAVAARSGFLEVQIPHGYENYKIPVGYPREVFNALEYDWQRLPDLLAVDDQCMAAHGLEARAPFTDEPIIQYAHELWEGDRIGKKVLKAAMRGIVPDAILDRTDKKGFPIPLVKWAQDELRDFVGDRIGYIPSPEKPWDRGWWYAMLENGKQRIAA